ncbi:MAG: CotH kinase family protein, partial [Aeromicrobium sp.]
DLGLGSATRAGNVVSPTGWYLRNVLSISAKQSSKTWFNRLNEDPEFRSAVAARWNVLYPTLSSSTYIDQQKSIMAASAAENYKRWSYSKRISSYQVIKGSWSADVAYVKSWMSDRRSWLNGQY